METPLLIPGTDAVQETLVDGGAGGGAAVVDPPRLRRPDRLQGMLLACCLDELLPADHAARAVWSVVERLDLSAFCAPLRARGEEPGRPATDPRLLTALWLYATIEGIGSGREIVRLCECHSAFRWLCGGVPVNYHTLNDFRVGHEQALDELFSQMLAVLIHKQVVSVRRIAQDGTKVRADAGRHTFRGEATLQRLLEEARRHVQAVKARSDDAAAGAQARAAQERAAREHVERIEAALAELPLLRADQQQSKRPDVRAKQPRASTTDAEARIMKMPDNGYRPAYNVQLATDVVSRAIVGVEVVNARSDHQQAGPMREQVERRSGARVEEHLLDGGYVQLAEIERAEAAGTRIYAPPQKSKYGAAKSKEDAAKSGDDAVKSNYDAAQSKDDAVISKDEAAGPPIHAPPRQSQDDAKGAPTAAPPRQSQDDAAAFTPKRSDGPGVAAWRVRMGTEAARSIYSLRASTAEPVNADLKQYRGLARCVVRGLRKVRCQALWAVLAYNIMHFAAALTA